MKTVVAIFNTRTQAREAANRLSAAGFDQQLINVISSAATSSSGTGATSDPANAARADAAQQPNDGLFNATYTSGSHVYVTPGVSGVISVADAEDGSRETTQAADREIPSQGVDVEGALPNGFRQTLAGWGLSKDQIDHYSHRLAQGGVLLSLEIPDETMVAKAQEILGQEGGA